MSGNASAFVSAAHDFAQTMLSADFRRFRHTVGVVLVAGDIASTVSPEETDLLYAAAWLHDVGYAPAARDTGFHPLDGARLLEREGWPQRLCGLVAFHSGASYVAEDLGLSSELRHFRQEQGALADALTYADQVTGPFGQHMAIEDRIADMLGRHGPDSPNARVHPARGPYLHETAVRVERRMAHQPPTLAAGRHRAPDGFD